uniref:NIDO domain-containing protein n=1 Tax=Pygocentrus nattereri TaxID=42514 RepID=A0AAR2KTK3_PYGNA
MAYLLPLCLTVLLCMSGQSDAGQLTLNNEDSVEVQLDRPFLYFGTWHTKLYLARNGFLAFFQPLLPDANPDPHIAKDIIAPLWTDIETNNTGIISYDQATSGNLIQVVTNDINILLPGVNFSASWVFLCKWTRVHLGHDAGVSASPMNLITACMHTNFNIFLLLKEANFRVFLTSNDDNESYIFMIYDDIPPTDQVWLAGYSAKNNINFVNIPVHNITDLSSGTNIELGGRWVFKVQRRAYGKFILWFCDSFLNYNVQIS